MNEQVGTAHRGYEVAAGAIDGSEDVVAYPRRKVDDCTRSRRITSRTPKATGSIEDSLKKCASICRESRGGDRKNEPTQLGTSELSDIPELVAIGSH